MLYHIKLLYNKSEKDTYFSKRFMIGCVKNTQQIGYNSKPLDLHQVCNRSIQVFGCSYIMQPNQACFPQPTAFLLLKNNFLPITRETMAQIAKMEVQLDIKSSAQSFYEIFRRKQYLIPKICLDILKDVQVIKGDWESLGSIKQWTYVAGIR